MIGIRITAKINSNQLNEKVSRSTVANLNTFGLKSKLKAKFVVTANSNHKEPVAENILNCQFYSEE